MVEGVSQNWESQNCNHPKVVFWGDLVVLEDLGFPCFRETTDWPKLKMVFLQAPKHIPIG